LADTGAVLARERAAAVAQTLDGWNRRSGPLYCALADALADALATRRIGPHLPSERALAVALHVGRGTVTNAYEMLRERRLLEREQGSGTVASARRPHSVCANPLACVAEFFAENVTCSPLVLEIGRQHRGETG
jgi:DNA-binding GntR family transcriptional regulator